jgi:hypothetical protein
MAWLTCAAAGNEAAINTAQSNMPKCAAAKPVCFMVGVPG